LGRLADRARATGLAVTLRTDPDPLPPDAVGTGTALAAYRIVQESLTNVTRHAAGATAVRVEVTRDAAELRILVEDDGSGGAPPGGGSTGPDDGTGSGIGGMRERARALGGELTAGHTDSGFRVTARLPLAPLPEGQA
ncbi:sensor histidine kinase, partial [Streptomyces harbinensis]|uniref:sensor histidine kinase n=1 Tax=Streptomyces harbinensis TaxID=1176198 RepID=UPI0034DE73B1